jgi:hypothetical protein
VRIKEDSNALSLLHQTVETLNRQLHVEQITIKNARDSELNIILQSMQKSIVRLETKSSYSEMTRIKIEQTSTKVITLSKMSDTTSRIAKMTREFTISIKNEKEKKSVQTLFTKETLNNLQKKSKRIRKLVRLSNDALRIQTKSKKKRKILQKKSEIIKRIADSITICSSIYVIRANKIKVENINTIN